VELPDDAIYRQVLVLSMAISNTIPATTATTTTWWWCF